MDSTYINALIESLERKIAVLKDIHLKDEEQYELADTSPFPFEAFDKNAEEKSVLIYKLGKLDEGFELVYEKIREELTINRSAHSAEIKRMQEMIATITDLSTKIQAEEARNKAKIENAFRFEKEKIKQQRSSVKAIQSYTQTMQGIPRKNI